MAKEKRTGKQTAEVAEKTKRNIMDAAAMLFAANGFNGTSLREIAAAADLSHGIIRHHFGSKLEIWQAIAESAFERYTKEMVPIVMEASQSDAPYDAFVGVVKSFIRNSLEQPELICLMVKEGGKNQKGLISLNSDLACCTIKSPYCLIVHKKNHRHSRITPTIHFFCF